MNIDITQNSNNIEWVTSNIIKKMYLMALDSDNEVSYSGYLKSDSGYLSHVLYLNNTFGPGLKIEVLKYYIDFEDPEAERLLSRYVGDGLGVSPEDTANYNIGLLFTGNTTITSFNEFRYFTKANTNPVNGMFFECTNLSSIDLSETTAFSSQEFLKTAITDVNAPNLISVPSGSAHIFNNIKSLLTVTSLGHITRISGDMFWGCDNLQSVNLPVECVEIQGSAFYCMDVSSGSLQTVTGLENVTSFGYRCFRNLKQLLLTAQDLAGVVSIGNNAFQGVKISSINSPKLTTLGEVSFADNSVLTTIECLGKVSSIPLSCFGNDSSLLTVKIPYECTSIGTTAFLLDSSLTSVKQYTDSIDNWVEGVEPTTGPLSRVTSFGLACFLNCSLLLLTQQDIQNATTIGKNAFNGTLLSGQIDLSNASSIGEGAFANTKITSVNLGHNITSIPVNCFQDCTNLSYIYGLENVTHIGAYFANRSGLFSRMDVLHFDNAISSDRAITNYEKWGVIDTCHMYFPKLEDIPGGLYINGMYHDGLFTNRGSFNCTFAYFKNISTVKPGSFGCVGLKTLVINNTTPPSVTGIVSGDEYRQSDKIFSDSVIENIYVPDASISAYQNSDFLSYYLQNGYTKNNVRMYPQLRGMSELTHYATEADWVAAGKPVNGIIDAYM